jgi:NADH dehydrogenase
VLNWHFTSLAEPCSWCVAAAVGTVQVRSLVEPLRKIVARLRGHYVDARAIDLVMSERLLELETLTSTGKPQRVYLP